MVTTPVLVLPGYGDSDPGHWQSLWQAADGNVRRVLQRDWLMPERGEWLASLDREIAACSTPPVLVAHSLGCALVAHRVRAGDGGIKAALLVAPADVDMLATVLEAVQSFAPMPLLPLPFPSVVVASTDDPYVTPARAEQFARAWGSRFVTLTGAGHVNTDSGFGAWAEGRRLLDALL
ncbi:MAG TPA: alpha/beta hydrolase [Patescibacteria group bacterium]|nr:alpha/beta hydrolase [Patescibacteria group bacterium]